MQATKPISKLSDKCNENFEEKLLVKDCLAKKPEAQKKLYDTYSKSMLSVCYRFTKSMTDAEDVLQEGFIRVFTNLHQYNFDGPLGAWIRRIMVNVALNFLKQNKNYQYDMLYTDDLLHPITNENPEVQLQAKELADMIRQLPTGYQTIFNLHAVEGYSHVEIAAMLGINDGTSRSQYAKARNLLIKWIEKYSSLPKREANGEN